MYTIAMPSPMRIALATALATALLGLPPTAGSQALPDAGRALESLEQRRPTLPAPAPIDLHLPDVPAAMQGGGPPVEVRRFAIEGNSAIACAELQALLSPLIGQSLTLSDIEAGIAAITRRYRERGYPFAYAYLPAQTVESGLLRVAVIEGRLGEVRLENASRQRSTVLQAPLAGLHAGALLRADALESSLLLLADVAGIRAEATLQPGARFGSSDLVVRVDDGPVVGAALGMDNFGNRYTGAWRGSASLQLDGALGLGEQIQLQLLASNEDLYNYRLGYQMPVGPWSTRIGASLSHLDYALDQEFGVLDAYGSAKVASVHATQPLLRSRSANVNARLQYDQKRLTDHIGMYDTQERKHSQLTTLGLDGNWQDSLGGRATNQWSLAWVHGQLRLGNVAQQQRDAQTARSAGSFQMITANLARWQALGGPWSLHGRVNGQRADGNLDSSEKMSLGGAYGVRAYPQGEAPGDHGLLATLELRYALGGDWQLSGFADSGKVRLQHRPWNAVSNHRRLSGAGLGLQRSGRDWSMETALAWRVGSAAATSAPDKRPRLWVKAQKFF